MRYQTHQFIFHRIYEMASLIEDCVSDPESFSEIDWYDRDVRKCLSEFSKTSLLHYYIYDMIWTAERNELIENDDIYEDSEIERAKVEATLQAYNVEYVPYSEFLSNLSASESKDLPFRQWFRSQEDGFDVLWGKMTNEVFYLLFANRAFLLQFNLSLADFLGSGEVEIPPEYLDQKGVLKRQSYFPTWVKKAIYYRDQGRCVLCQRDLRACLAQINTFILTI